jgi:serine/threonine protein kinase
MSAEYTQDQSSDDQRRAKELSLKRTRPPTEVPGYEAQRFLGSGAYGEVWVGLDQNTGRRVAIKFYTHRGGVDWSLLSREVEKLVFLSADRYVVQLLDVGWDAEPPYYVMDYIENGSLEDLLRENGPLPTAEAMELFHEICVGLMHMHGKGVLHCDLKPANVLLDEDHKPRLADFGQSRLSHEQSPALGTLFYMAPEQADMEAVPDARWDVYALGALLYCLLTGQVPYRSEDMLRQFDSAVDLADRLARYRHSIRSAPPPRAHRKVPGVDRPLAEIIERCLAVDPNERFGSVHSVLESLHAREQARVRRPLQVLGIVGPTLLLLIMALFGFRGYRQAISDSEHLANKRAKESSLFAAQMAAEKAAREIDRYFRAVEQVAEDPELQRRFLEVTGDPQLAEMLQGLSDPNASSPEYRQLRARYIKLIDQLPLQAYINKLLVDPRKPIAASWFVTMLDGTQVAASFNAKEPAETRGRNYGWRTYFHGGIEDLRFTETIDGKQITRYQRPPPGQHITGTHLSAVFQSTGTNTWKVAVSAPLIIDGEFQGVVAMTIEIGNIVEFRKTKERSAVLVDGRAGRTQGVVLQHPLYDELLDEQELALAAQRTALLQQIELLKQQQQQPAQLQAKVLEFEKLAKQQASLPPRFGVDPEYRVPLGQLDANGGQLYRDPLGRAPEGTAYAKDWIAAKAPVLQKVRVAGSGDFKSVETGLFVIVQEDYQSVIGPVEQLDKFLLRQGILALTGVVLVVFVLWYFVFRMLNNQRNSGTFRSTARSTSPSLHSMKTLSAPNRHRPTP